MKNSIQEGNVLELVAPSGGVVSGKPYKIGALLVVACVSALATVKFAGETKGVFKFVKATGLVLAEGDLVEWDAATGTIVADADAAGDFDLGYVTEVAGAGQLYAYIKLKAV